MSDASPKRGWMLVVGVLVLVAGLVAAGALWYAAGQRRDDNVASFARAPAGCATTLDFDRSGAFTLYIETTGNIDDLTGDCAAPVEYDRDGVLVVDVSLVDADGAPVTIEASSGVDYDTGTFAGTSTGVVEITEPGDHVLTVVADGDAFAIAVGGDPDDGVGLLRWSAVFTAIAALMVGGVLLVLGSRRPAPPSDADAPWQPAPGRPTSPPGFPAPPPTTGATGPAGPPIPTPPGTQPASPPAGPPPLEPAPVPPSPVRPPSPPGWGPPSLSSDA